MHDVLQSLGFNVRTLVGRVVNNKDIDTPRTHRVTLLEFDDEKYLVDVGFGAMCPNKPIKIDTTKSIEEEYRVIQNSKDEYQIELLTKNGYFTLYRFNLVEYTDSDCIMGNFYSSQHPKAVFVNNFVASLILPNITLSLRNARYHRISKNSTEIITLNDYMQLYLILKDDFNIPISKEDSESIFKSISK